MRSLLRPLLTLSLLLAAFPAVLAAQSQPSLRGECRLLEFNRQDSTGAMVPSDGPKSIGILIYTASGRMSAQLCDERRPPVDNDTMRLDSPASAAPSPPATASSGSGSLPDGADTVRSDARWRYHALTVRVRFGRITL